MSVRESLEKTSRQLKFDYDGTNPEWFIIMHLINILYFFPHAVIRRSSSGKGFHVYVAQPSDLDVRCFHREDKGRIWCTQLRAQILNVTENHDIIYQRKGTLKILKTNKGLIYRWTRKPTGDSEPLSMRDVLALPFCSQIDFHRKRRVRYWKRKKGEEKHEANRREI
jgi:hypothetical protein